jgi:hypothetical protein
MHLAYRDVLAFNLKELANTDETSFVEFENRLGEVWNVVWHNGTWLVTGADDSGAEPRARTLGLDDVLAFTAVQLEK